MADESEIIEAFSRDKERGFKMLMDTYQEPLYNYIRRLVVSFDDAKDILQETFIHTYYHLHSFRRESKLSTWIYKIATNECLRYLEKRNKEGQSVARIDDINIALLQSGEYIDYDNAMAVKFQEAVLRLPEKQQVVFNLHYYEEMKYEDISSITGTKVETVKVNYHLAKEKIKQYIIND